MEMIDIKNSIVPKMDPCSTP